jgi:hypothetical protein
VTTSHHEVTGETSRPVSGEDEALVIAFAALGVRDATLDIEWVQCNVCHALHDHRNVTGRERLAAACIRCVPDLIPD